MRQSWKRSSASPHQDEAQLERRTASPHQHEAKFEKMHVMSHTYEYIQNYEHSVWCALACPTDPSLCVVLGEAEHFTHEFPIAAHLVKLKTRGAGGTTSIYATKPSSIGGPCQS